ncbi:hypothetical protein KQI74_19355 [Paenibacillus barcinonensis]|uniref:hypothetical protein n=1 Tax=Paenibacillus barcinonensis TaxID=198119 RepID=UPI001C0FBFD3|nr:hypothetical protein [Paenibacillus barcinonensis]MBU5354452.1 hypothetical protein [Paenibacillus barcinonensis]
MQDIFLANIGIKGIVHECATRQAGRVGFIMKKNSRKRLQLCLFKFKITAGHVPDV